MKELGGKSYLCRCNHRLRLLGRDRVVRGRDLGLRLLLIGPWLRFIGRESEGAGRRGRSVLLYWLEELQVRA